MKTKINDLEINYEIYNQELLKDMNRPPLVLIHAFPYSLKAWEPQVQAFSEDRSVLAYDLRGLGESAVGTGQYFLEDYVDDLMGLLDYLEVPKAILCGLSIGGYIALRAVERNPDRVAGLVLADTMSSADTNEGKLKRYRYSKMIEQKGMHEFTPEYLDGVFLDETIESKKEIVQSIHHIVENNHPRGVVGGFMALASRTDTTPALSKVKVPTLVIVGEKDEVTPLAAAQSIQEKIPGAQLVVIPNAGHLSNLENPAEFNRALRNYLAHVDQAGSRDRLAG